MKAEEPNRAALIGYMEEALPAEEMARIEEQLRVSQAWRDALVEIQNQVDAGDASVATIWRRHRLTCPSRERLGAYLMKGLGDAETDYIRFHLEVIRCRWCAANLADVAGSLSPESAGTAARRRRIFDSSVGHLPPPR